MAELDPGAGGWAGFEVGDARFGDITSFFEPLPGFPGIQITPTHTGATVPLGVPAGLRGGAEVLPRISLPNVFPITGWHEASASVSEVAGDVEIPAEESLPYVIDPNERPQWVVWETPGIPTEQRPVSGVTGVPGMFEGFWDTVGAIGSAYVNTAYAPQPMSFNAPPMGQTMQPNTGASLNQQMFGVPDQVNAAAPATVAAVTGGNGCCPSPAGCGPKYAKICLSTNVITPLRRRRRRKLLTSSDLNQLAALKAIIGGGAGLNAAVVKAMR